MQPTQEAQSPISVSIGGPVTRRPLEDIGGYYLDAEHSMVSYRPMVSGSVAPADFEIPDSKASMHENGPPPPRAAEIGHTMMSQ